MRRLNVWSSQQARPPLCFTAKVWSSSRDDCEVNNVTADTLRTGLLFLFFSDIGNKTNKTSPQKENCFYLNVSCVIEIVLWV